MFELSLFFIASLLVGVVSYFISEEKDREKKSTYYYGKSLMAYREGDYYTSGKYLKKAMIVPSSHYINQSEAEKNLKVLDLTDLVLLQLNMDSTEVTLSLRKFLFSVKGIEMYNSVDFEKVIMLYDELMSAEQLDQEMLMHISRSHLKVHRNPNIKDELALSQRAI